MGGGGSDEEEETAPHAQRRPHGIMELDLDALERGWECARPPPAALPSPTPSPDAAHLVHLVLLGAPGVGKTSIVQRFVWNEFSEEYVPTERRHTYYPSAVVNGRLYALKIADVPVVPFFPVDAHLEWGGLRGATAYLLVFDLAQAGASFRFVRTLRAQMQEARDLRRVPLLVAANKQDLVAGPAAAGGEAESSGAEAEAERRAIAALVRDSWRCAYIECSAKRNWRVAALFKELLLAVEALESGGAPGGRGAHCDDDTDDSDAPATPTDSMLERGRCCAL